LDDRDLSDPARALLTLERATAEPFWSRKNLF
jgi:hypothetical protein